MDGVSVPRRLEYMLLSELVEADRNPKEHHQAAIRQSLAKFNFVEPVVLDERTGKLIAGHGRREALLEAFRAGESPPEGVVAGPGGWLVPVMRGWASRDDNHAHAAGVALNQTTIAGDFDHEDLADLLQSIHAEDPDLVGATGFEDFDLDVLLNASARDPFVPELPASDLEGFKRDDGKQPPVKFSGDDQRVVMEAVALVRQVHQDDTLTTDQAIAIICRQYVDAHRP